ncbi:alcohol dehydrogenase [Coniochaeta ligniaria NRRL 30616]|uniref:Alcohol dehydrogenase n=1 Tax=Coniochaeta ligniaria NRRL 30616 TaxID=1408157 RepID=A0A1J7JSK0_9PEZI|nr:alcohol dehydrogenase [Coniochaeta ligniaria NRRL 30616]
MSRIPDTTSTSRSRGQYLHGVRALKGELRELAPLASDEVRIAIRCTSICGSDVHYFNHLCNGSIRVREPLCLGHEASGQIVAVGSGASHVGEADLKPGDAVALECGVACGQCAHCRGRRYNICPQLRFRSSGSKFPHYQGTLQELVDHPARWVHRIPPELGFEVGALLEPLAVAVHAVRRAGPDTIPSTRPCCLVFGAGAIGLLCAAAARADGCQDVVMVDMDQGRLAFALEQGFASVVHAVKPRRGETLQDRLDIARETAVDIAGLKWPDGNTIGRVQKTFECTGAESCLHSSIYATESGGTVVLVGMGTPNHTLPISELTAREINLVSTWRYADAYPRAIAIAKASVTRMPIDGNRLPDITQMITHRYQGLDLVQDALEMAGKTRDAAGRLVVKTVVDL